MKIYVASSWRNDYQPDVVRGLRELGHEVYNFRKPSEEGPDGGCEGHLDDGFHWEEIDGGWKSWTVDGYVAALDHPLAIRGFRSDFDAMKWAEACVLVMPCGRSAHLEAGYFVGAGKPLLILADSGEPELMYKMADGVFAGLGPLLVRLQEIEVAMPAKCERCDGDGKAHGADRPFEWSGPGSYPGLCPVCKGSGKVVDCLDESNG